MHLLAAGDSLTYGFDVPMPSRWLTKLAATLPDLQVTNLGMCGAGLDQVLQRAERTLREPVAYDLLFLMAGSNDIMQDAENEQPLDIRPLVRKITAFSSTHAALPIVIGIPPEITKEAIYTGWQSAPAFPYAVAAFQEYGDALVRAFPQATLDFRRLLAPNEYDDGVHPNIYGYAKMAKHAQTYFASSNS